MKKQKYICKICGLIQVARKEDICYECNVERFFDPILDGLKKFKRTCITSLFRKNGDNKKK